MKLVRLKLLEPEDLESLGLAAQSRYDDSAKDDQPRRDGSRHRADTHSKPHSGTVDKGSSHSHRGSGRHDRRFSQSPHPGSSRHKEESMFAKLMARKEQEKKYKKIVDNPMLYFGGAPTSNPPGRTPAGDPLLAVLWIRSGGSRH